MVDERMIREVNQKENAKNPWHSRIHVIKNVTYRQAISWGGFFSYKHSRNMVSGHDHFFMQYSQEDYDVECEMIPYLRNKCGVERTWEWIYHDDLYSFYEYVGYDRVTKTFSLLSE